VLKAPPLLGAILQLALESERIARNPVRTVRKVARLPKKEVRPLPPATVEAMRAASGMRDATLISVLAYAGAAGRGARAAVEARRQADAHGLRAEDEAAPQRAAAGSPGGGPGRVAARVTAERRRAGVSLGGR
jgi:hypothetical protein